MDSTAFISGEHLHELIRSINLQADVRFRVFAAVQMRPSL